MQEHSIKLVLHLSLCNWNHQYTMRWNLEGVIYLCASSSSICFRTWSIPMFVFMNDGFVVATGSWRLEFKIMVSKDVKIYKDAGILQWLNAEIEIRYCKQEPAALYLLIANRSVQSCICCYASQGSSLNMPFKGRIYY